MAFRDIGASLKLNGEAAFKKALGEAQREVSNLNAELKLSQAEFDGQANSAEALGKKLTLLRQKEEQQKEIVEKLAQAVQDAADEYGEADKRTDSLRRQYASAQTQLVKLNREIDDNEKYLKEAENAADGCATSIDGYGKKVKQAESESGGLTDAIGKLIPGFDKLAGIGGGGGGALAAAGVIGGVAAAATKAVDWMMNLVDETAELRTSLAKLDASAERAGVAMDDRLTDNLIDLYSVADGDWDSAFEALSNLLQAGLDSELPEVINSLAGAVETFPDTLKIESLADSLQETIATGSATGQFAELLDRMGLSTDTFNASMEAAISTEERQQIALDALASTGLAQVNEQYQVANAEQLALTEAQAGLELANAQLAESFIPLKTWLTNVNTGFKTFLSQVLEAGNHGGTIFSAIAVGLQSGKAAGDEAGVSMSQLFAIMDENSLSFRDLRTAAEESGVTMGEYVNQLAAATEESGEADTETQAMTQALSNVEIAAGRASAAMDTYAAAAGRAAAAGSSVGGVAISGSHAAGLSYVPYDGYVAELHRGERVLTAQQSRAYSAGGGGGGSSVVVNISAPSLNQSQVDYIVSTVNKRLGGSI